MELPSAVGKSEGYVLDDTSVGHADEAIHLVLVNVKTLLGHDVGSLLRGCSRKVSYESEWASLGFVKGINSNVHLTSTSCEKQVVLLVEV